MPRVLDRVLQKKNHGGLVSNECQFEITTATEEFQPKGENPEQSD
jgi:hypothetical protein